MPVPEKLIQDVVQSAIDAVKTTHTFETEIKRVGDNKAKKLLEAIEIGVIESARLDQLLVYLTQQANNPSNNLGVVLQKRLNILAGTVDGRFQVEQKVGVLTVRESNGNSAFATSGYSDLGCALPSHSQFLLYFARRTEDFPEEIAYQIGFDCRIVDRAVGFLINCLFLDEELFSRIGPHDQGVHRSLYNLLAPNL